MEKLVIAGKEYPLPDLFTLGQLKKLSMISVRSPPDTAEKFEEYLFDQSVDLVVVALSKSETPLTAEGLYDTTTNITEMLACRKLIQLHSGLTVKELPKGEADAGPGPAP